MEKEKIISLKGAIFCHVIKRVAEVQGALFMTDGNQKWKGAAPNLAVNPSIVNSVREGESIPIKINALPKAWNRRYFNLASDSWNQLDEARIGTKEIILISKDIQIINQWEDESAITVLDIRVNKNKLM